MDLHFPKSATYKSSNNVLHSSYMEVRIDATSPFEKLAKKIKSENKKNASICSSLCLNVILGFCNYSCP